jgi:phosphonate transport system substrate-binding protein
MAELRVGTFLAPNMMPVYEAITETIARRLGTTAELVVETSYENCATDVNDVCFVCSLPYVMFEREGISPSLPTAAPVLTGARFGGKPIYFSDVIVRAESGFGSFLDLRGCRWAYNEPLSQSGYGITRYHLVTLGETNGFFGDVIEAGYHETAIEMVRDGEVDAAAIDCQVLAVAVREHPDLTETLRVVETLGPSTIQPIGVSRRLGEAVRASIRDALVTMHEDRHLAARLAHGFIERLVPVEASSYDDIRAMVDECERAGFMRLR